MFVLKGKSRKGGKGDMPERVSPGKRKSKPMPKAPKAPKPYK
jgi:hypothetical protein